MGHFYVDPGMFVCSIFFRNKIQAIVGPFHLFKANLRSILTPLDKKWTPHSINQDRQVNISYLYANIYQEPTESVV